MLVSRLWLKAARRSWALWCVMFAGSSWILAGRLREVSVITVCSCIGGLGVGLLRRRRGEPCELNMVLTPSGVWRRGLSLSSDWVSRCVSWSWPGSSIRRTRLRTHCVRNRTGRNRMRIPRWGVLLCADKNDAVVRFSLPENNQTILTSRYQLYLPAEEQLAAELR